VEDHIRHRRRELTAQPTRRWGPAAYRHICARAPTQVAGSVFCSTGDRADVLCGSGPSAAAPERAIRAGEFGTRGSGSGLGPFRCADARQPNGCRRSITPLQMCRSVAVEGASNASLCVLVQLRTTENRLRRLGLPKAGALTEWQQPAEQPNRAGDRAREDASQQCGPYAMEGAREGREARP
jgi:hypothetical protein